MNLENEKEYSYCNSPLFKIDNENDRDTNMFFEESADEFQYSFKNVFNIETQMNKRVAIQNDEIINKDVKDTIITFNTQQKLIIY
jgi:hypothetical protein